ncbi:non-specific lipid-transfer protein-like protein [Tanacetum coccineum]
MITMATRYGGVTAQFFGCASLITTSMPDCSSFLAGTSLTASVGCCTEFESVMKSQAQCLCQAFNDTASFPGLSGLAKVCNVDKPSECNGTKATGPSANDATSTKYTTFPILCLLLAAAYAMVF